MKNKKIEADYRDQELREKFDTMMEADRKLKAEKDRKRREHEEDMFILDLNKAYEAEQAQGEAMQKKKKELEAMDKAKTAHEEKIKKSNETKQKTVEELQKYIHEKNAKWDERRFVAVNKDNTISQADYKMFVPKRRQ